VELQSEKFIPFRQEKYKILPEPRLIFTQQDTLRGILKSSQQPVLRLVNVDDENDLIPLTNVNKDPTGLFLFTLPLSQVKPDYYFFSVRIGNQEVYRTVITITAAEVQKTIDLAPRGEI